MPIIYILTNKWYKVDNMYKVGKHQSNDIDKLLLQYSSRYMPGRELVQHWIVDDCTTTELILHDALDDSPVAERVEGEWYRGDIDSLILLIEENIKRCMYDPYTLRIRIRDRFRVYPLSVISHERLAALGTYLGIHNPLDTADDNWRTLQMSLIFSQKRIIHLHESEDKMSQETQLRFSQLTGHPPGEKLLSLLYLYVKPRLSSVDAHSLSSVVLRDPQRVRSSRPGAPYTYDANETPTDKILRQLSHDKMRQENNYESMTIRELYSILHTIAPKGFSYIVKKEDIIKAIRHPELIPSMIENGRNRRSKPI